MLVSSVELDRRQLAAVHAIYEEAFPSTLRVEFGDLTEPDAGGRVMFAMLSEAEVTGFCACLLLGDTEIVFLRYFAVANPLRSRGVGRAMWTSLLRQLCGLGGGQLVFEVEHPSEVAPESLERRTRERRVAFYQRCGAVVLPITDYQQPNLTDAALEPEPMLLMGADTGLRQWPLSGPPEGELREVVLALYKHRYGVGPSDPIVRAAISSIPC